MNAAQIKAEQDALFRACAEQKAKREAGLLKAPRASKARAARVAAIRARRQA
jgi:hypothetical protein